MPIPMRVARWNRAGLNRLTIPLLRLLPGFAVVHHVGRRSGLARRTPVNLFTRPGGFVIALTYGPGTDWVRNVLAAGGCEVETRGRRVRCTAPRVYHDPRRRGIRLPERPLLGLLDVDHFLDLTVADDVTDLGRRARPEAPG